MGGGGGRVPPREFPPGNFWQLIGKNEARKRREKKGKMENVEENEENGKGKEENEEKWGKMKK